MKHRERFSAVLRLILTAAGFLFFLHIEYNSLRYIFTHKLKAAYIIHNANFLVLSVVFIFLAVTGFVLVDIIAGSLRIRPLSFIIALAGLSFTLRLAFILLFDSTPVSDFMLLYRGAEEVAKGNYDFVKKAEYFLYWVYQIGFVSYQALVIRIFGQGWLALKILNAVFSTGTCIMVYLAARRVFSENAGRTAALAYSLFPPSIYMCSVLTNQVLATFLFYIALYLAAGKLKNHSFVLLGLTAALGNIIRPEGPLILMAIFVFLLFFKKEKKTGAFSRNVGIIAGTLVVFFAVIKIADLVLISSGISDFPLSNRDPLWKFVVGLNYDTYGQYSSSDFARISRFPLGRERAIEELKLIRERTADVKKLTSLLKAKIRIMWSDFDHSFISFVAPGTNLTPFKISFMLYCEKCFYSAIVFYILTGLGYLTLRKGSNPGYLLYLVLILGYAAVLLFIEIQLRYRYLAMPAFFILSGYGISLVSEKLRRILRISRS